MQCRCSVADLVLLQALILQPCEEAVRDLEVQQLVEHSPEQRLKLVAVARYEELDAVHGLVQHIIHPRHLGDV